jgi:intracellular multiplication protein IcmV
MAIRDIFKISWKTFINPLGWIDYEGLKNQNITIITAIKSLFSSPPAEHTETFEQAKKRLGLTEEEIQASANRYRLYAIAFFILGLIIFIYTFYILFVHFTLIGFILGLSVSGLFFAYAFKYDFWAFQIKRRKLGASFAEWKRHILGDKEGGAR